MLLLSGCGVGKISQTAICDGLDPLVDRHSEALQEDGGPKSIITGATLIRSFDSGCGKEV